MEAEGVVHNKFELFSFYMAKYLYFCIESQCPRKISTLQPRLHCGAVAMEAK